MIQESTTPSIYFDHWALRLISENYALGERFVKALKARSGTFMVSWLNAVEFSGVTDKRQVRMAENFLDRLRPNLFFIKLDPWKVIQEENFAIANKISKSSPSSDDVIMKAFLAMERDGIDPLSFNGVFVQFQHEPKIINSVIDAFLFQVNKMRGQYTQNLETKKLLNKAVKGSHFLPATRLLIGELLRIFIKNQSQVPSRNDAVDFLHSVVPLSYCDFVLLDGHWAHQARVASTRLHGAGQIEKVAMVLTGVSAVKSIVEILEKQSG